MVPLVVPDGMDFDEFAETTAFRQVAQTITALSTQDERSGDLIELGEPFDHAGDGFLIQRLSLLVDRPNWGNFT